MFVVGQNTEDFQKEVGATASGAISKGDTVLLNSNGTVTSVSGGTLTSENFLGFAAAGYANGQNARILVAGSIDENQTGLTAGQAYYVQTDGSLSTTPDSPSVFAGTAISANKIVVKG